MLYEKRACTRTKDNIICRAELEACNFIKTVLMLVVVFYHSVLFWNGTWFTKDPAFEAAPLAWIAVWMNSFHIYGFTLVSGYIFYHVKYKAGRYKDYKSFLINKAKRLLVPYAFAAMLWVIPFHCCFMMPEITDIINKYVLGVSPSQLWFILMLFGVFAIMWPLSDLCHKNTIAGGAVIVALYLTGKIGARCFPNLFQIWTACTYCLYFWIGMKLCQYVESRSIITLKKAPVWLWILADIALYVWIKRLHGSSILLKLFVEGLNLLLNILGAWMAFVVLGRISQIVPWKKSKMFSFLSGCSFPIYLFHQQLIYCTIYLLNGKVNPYVNASVNFMTAVGGSILISWMLMRFRMTRVLIGEKN